MKIPAATGRLMHRYGPFEFGPHARERLGERCVRWRSAEELGGEPKDVRKVAMLLALERGDLETGPWWYVQEGTTEPIQVHALPIIDAEGEDGEPLVAVVGEHLSRHDKFFVLTVLTRAMAQKAEELGAWAREPRDLTRYIRPNDPMGIGKTLTQPLLGAAALRVLTDEENDDMARAQDFSKKDRVEVCIAGEPLDGGRWVPATVHKVFSRGLKIRLDTPFAGQTDVSLPFARIRLLESHSDRRAKQREDADLVAAITKPVAPTPLPAPLPIPAPAPKALTPITPPPPLTSPSSPPRTGNASAVLVAEAEAAIALAGEPLRKLAERLGELGNRRKARLDETTQAKLDLKKKYEEDLVRLAEAERVELEELDAEITKMKAARDKLAKLLAQLRE